MVYLDNICWLDVLTSKITGGFLMVLIFASSFILSLTLLVLNPELFLKGDALKKVRSWNRLKAGFGIVAIFLGIILSVYFIIHFITELKWILVIILGFFLVMVGSVSASSFLSSTVKNENLIAFFLSIQSFYDSLKKAVPKHYLGYFLLGFSVFSIIISIVIDF